LKRTKRHLQLVLAPGPRFLPKLILQMRILPSFKRIQIVAPRHFTGPFDKNPILTGLKVADLERKIERLSRELEKQFKATTT